MAQLWKGQAIAVAKPSFDLEKAICQAMEEREERLADDLFSLSPLSLPETTPPPHHPHHSLPHATYPWQGLQATQPSILPFKILRQPVQ